MARLKFVFSFYSSIDLLAFVPYYAALALPGSVIDQYDEYLRMSRIFRLLKLEKFVPSFTLVDDVIRFKWSSLRVAGFAALTLWVIFGGLLTDGSCFEPQLERFTWQCIVSPLLNCKPEKPKNEVFLVS